MSVYLFNRCAEWLLEELPKRIVIRVIVEEAPSFKSQTVTWVHVVLHGSSAGRLYQIMYSCPDATATKLPSHFDLQILSRDEAGFPKALEHLMLLWRFNHWDFLTSERQVAAIKNSNGVISALPLLSLDSDMTAIFSRLLGRLEERRSTNQHDLCLDDAWRKLGALLQEELREQRKLFQRISSRTLFAVE